ncbi:MAG: GAP family protein [Verrucomicrobia bacterium]|nr:GAP family protein [Verrucomicrobiota bacterium]
MWDALVESLPIALGLLLATLPAVAIPLILLTRRETGVLLGFLFGWALGFMLLGSLLMLTADLLPLNPEGSPAWISRLRLPLGLFLLGLALKKWRARPEPGTDPELPRWLAAIETVRTPRALVLGFLLVVVNPKNAVLVSSGALAIASQTPVFAAQIGALLIFTVVASLGVTAPLVLWLLLGERAKGPLDQLKALLARYNSTFMTLVLATLGLMVIVGALREL